MGFATDDSMVGIVEGRQTEQADKNGFASGFTRLIDLWTLFAAGSQNVFDHVTAQLCAVLFQIVREILRDALVGTRHQYVGFEESIVIECLQFRERWAEGRRFLFCRNSQDGSQSLCLFRQTVSISLFL